jgi:thioredoxin reductase
MAFDLIVVGAGPAGAAAAVTSEAFEVSKKLE